MMTDCAHKDITLEEAIHHAFDVETREGCSACGDEHRQLAVWLMELHERRVGCWKEDPMEYRYANVEGLEEIQRYGKDGWRVVAADFKMGVWTALMELQVGVRHVEQGEGV